MANKTVALKMDKVRNLRYGINAIIQLEELMGRSVSEMTDDVSMKDLRTMLYVGLKWEDKELTEELTGDLMDLAIENEGMEEVSNKIGKAFQLAFGGTAAPSVKK